MCYAIILQPCLLRCTAVSDTYQLHSAQFIHQGHVARHEFLQWLVELVELFQSFTFGFLIFCVIEVFSGKWKSKNVSMIIDLKLHCFSMACTTHCGNLVTTSCHQERSNRQTITCIPQGPEAVALIDPAAPPCFASICLFLISHERPCCSNTDYRTTITASTSSNKTLVWFKLS